MTYLKTAVAGVLILLTAFFMLSVQAACACSPKWKAYQASVKSDLRNLVTAQEAAFADDSIFAAVVPATFVATPRVHVSVVEATRQGWRAVATHEFLDGECRIYVGRVAWRPMLPDGSVAEEGVPACWGVWPHEPSTRMKLRARLGMVERPRPLPQDSVPGVEPAPTIARP